MRKNKETCFIVTPIGATESSIRKKTDGLIDSVLDPVLRKFGYECVVAHRLSKPGSITKQVIEYLVHSELVIANLTGLNPNVMYELAVRHAVRKHVIVVAEKETQLPFDIASERALFYEDSFAGSNVLTTSLREAIQGLKSIKGPIDNPIYRAVDKSIMTPSYSDTSEIKEVINKLEELARASSKLPYKGKVENNDLVIPTLNILGDTKVSLYVYKNESSTDSFDVFNTIVTNYLGELVSSQGYHLIKDPIMSFPVEVSNYVMLSFRIEEETRDRVESMLRSKFKRSPLIDRINIDFS